MKFGIIGCGSIAENSFGPSLLASERTDLVAVCRRDLEAARAFAARFSGPRAYSSAAELVRDDRVEAVIVSTPTDTHCDYTCLAAEHGKHVSVREADGEKRGRVSRNDRRVSGSRRDPSGRLSPAHLSASGCGQAVDRCGPHRPGRFRAHPLQRALGSSKRGIGGLSRASAVP